MARLLPVLLTLLGSTSGFSQAQTFYGQVGEAVTVADLSDGKLPPRKLTASSDPSTSPEGKRIAFTRRDVEGKSASHPSLPVAQPCQKPTGKEFETFRSEWNAKAKAGDWKLVKRDLPVKEKGRKEFVGGWLEGNVLQRLVHVETLGEGNESITLYFWRDGQLTSVFQLRKGTMTEISEVNEATETYNFVDEKLVGWHRTGDAASDVDPGEPGFQDTGKQVLKESIKLAEPIYQAIGAD